MFWRIVHTALAPNIKTRQHRTCVFCYHTHEKRWQNKCTKRGKRVLELNVSIVALRVVTTVEFCDILEGNAQTVQCYQSKAILLLK